jgi:UDP-N-acetylglucosamine--N-acetylmuramyl-(pentapeptide) pyrophosphoryl-undecaprenol N-acetylglucosamine transferase
VLAFGGSQGSAALNRAVADALEQDLLENVNVLWGAGTAHARRYVGLERAGRVVVRAFLDPMAPAYQAATLVVCRAGAMTVAELCAWGKPSILVPLPTAAADHQTTNARALADAGGALVLKESELSGTTLDRLVRETLADSSRLAAMGAVAAKRGHPTAARDIVSKILTLIL